MGGSFSIVPEGNDTEVTVVVVSPDGQQQAQPSPSQFYPQPRKNYYHDPAAAPYGGSYGLHQYGQPHPGYPGYAPRPYGAPHPPPPLPPPYSYGDSYMAFPYSQHPPNPYGAPQYGQPYGYPQGQPPPKQYGPAQVLGTQPLTFKLVGLNQSQAQAQSTTVVTTTPPEPSDNARSASAIGDKIANQVWEKIQKKQQQQKQQTEAASAGSKPKSKGSKPPGGASGTPGSKVSKVPSNLRPPSQSILKMNRPTATSSSSTKSMDNANKMGTGPLVAPPNTDYVPGAMFSIADLAKINDNPKCGTQKSGQPFSNSKVQPPPPPEPTTLMVSNYKKGQVSAERSKSAIGSSYRTSIRSPDASKVENSGIGGSSKSKRPKSLAMGSSKKPSSASGRSSSAPSSHSGTSNTKSSNVEGSTKSTRTSGTEAYTRKQKAKQLDRAKAKAAAGKLATKNTKTKKPPTMDSTFFTLPKSTTDVGGATIETFSKGTPLSKSTGIPGSFIGCTPSSVGPSERPFPSAQTPSSGIGDSSSSSTSKASKPKSIVAGSKEPSSMTSIRNGRPQSVTSVRSNKSLKSIDKKVPAPSVGRWSSISSTSSTLSNTDKAKAESSSSNSCSTPVYNPDSKKSDYNENEKNKREGEIEARRSSDPDDKKDDDDKEAKDAKMKQKEEDAKKDSTKKRQDPDEC